MPNEGPAPEAASAPRVRRVVVGVDGSDDAALALRAAERAATALGAELQVVTVWHGVPAASAPASVDLPGLLELEHRAVVDARIGSALPVGARLAVLQGDAAHRLMQEARDADLLVLGGRGTGGFDGLPLGSVALLCVQHAPCSVLVVRAGETGPVTAEDEPLGGRVVVGVRGRTPRSATTLRAAAAAAGSLGASMSVVTAWSRPDGLPPSDASTDVVRAMEWAARTDQDAAIAQAFPVGSPVPHRATIQEGAAPAVLVQECAGADLLVVSADSRNTMTGTLLGPVALTVVAHAGCPVLVVRGAL